MILQGLGTVLVQQELSQYMGLKPNKNINTDDIEEEAFQEQQNEINEDKKDTNNLETNIDNLEKATTAFGIVTAIFTGLSVLSFVIWGVMILVGAFTFTPALVGAAFGMLYFGGICLVVASGAALVAMTLISVRAIINSIYKNLNKKIEPEQKDLDTYTQSKNNANMDVSTFDGVPIVKQPLDWKNYESLDTPRAEHGDVLMGPGIQFLYVPYEGYTGEDHFRIYAVNKNSINPLLINVNIKIQPIPIFTIPEEAS